ANGMQMRCTADHQHFTNQGWVATKDLVDVHAIYVQKGEGSLGQGTITVEQSQMLGWWYGDGYNVKIGAIKGHGRTSDHFAKGFVFNPQEYETAYPVVSAAVKSITGKTYATPLHKGVYEFRTQSRLLENFFAKLGIQDKNTLPTSFLRQSKEVLIGFLQGIFCADGTVEKHNRRIKLVNKSEQLLQQIQLILLQLGIISMVKCSRKKGYRGVSYTTSDGTQKISADSGSFSLCVRSISFNTFGDIIGFPLVRAKQEQLEQWMEKPLLNYSSSTINSKFTSKVKSVEELGEEPVYDLHVPLAHSFIANGCVTHNCGEIIGSNFHCVSGDTLLITRDGMHEIRSLVGESVEIWNGRRWSPVVPILTGKNRKLYRVSFSDGTYLDVTEKHRFFVRNRFGKTYVEMTTGELRHRLADCKYALHTEPFKIDYLDGKFVDSIWAYTLGQLVGDGAICQSNGKPQLQLRLYGAKSYQKLAIAGRTSGQLRYYAENPETPCLLYTGFQDQFDA
ncbi:MAG: endonuclease, partial [Prochloron sp. SP5CPC1]|nr:endonuclease [Candidatus Paraprochloron terpiosi SP5CPC1]